MMFDLNKEREAFEAWAKTASNGWASFTKYSDGGYTTDKLNFAWAAWQEKAKAQAVPENTEDWYLDEDEGLWLDHDGIDGTLCELGIGEVKPVKHKEYLITQSNTLYAARVWDSDDDHIAWKLFESEESALEAAAYCKQMYEASESGAEG